MSNVSISYRQNSIVGKSNVGMVVLLYERVIASLYAASRATDSQDLEARTNETDRVIRIFAHLRSTLDFSAGGEVAQSLDRFYSVITSQALRASIALDAQAFIDLANQVSAVAGAWRQIDQ